MKFGVCVESSHKKGMGHLFRAMNFRSYIRAKGDGCIIFSNPHPEALTVLQNSGSDFESVDLADPHSGWERSLAVRHAIDVWVNDRLDTDAEHARRVKSAGIKLVTFDDHGPGAALSDLHIASLAFASTDQAFGRKVLRGPGFLILNPEIAAHRRLRRRVDRIVVSLGGSDTYGVTVKVAALLKGSGHTAVIHIGPAFAHREALASVGCAFPLVESVPSLVKLFAGFDLAITGGGITPFEANAAGLPALVIANEPFEIPNGEALHSAGSSCFLGNHETLDSDRLAEGIAFASENLADMSQRGLSRFDPQDAFDRIYREILNA